jgi:epoxyqueuosine reductase
MTSSLTHRIKLKAAELGFSKVGAASVELLTEEGKHLREWFVREYHASMRWIEDDAEKRINPAKVLPNAKSIICVALNYFTPTQPLPKKSIGRISRYALGEDYHLVMTQRLQELFKFIKSEIPDVAGKFYVDTGPVMDKVWAARAGIGWMGKHTNVITREFGSWVFLGEILLDVELEYDLPVLDHCGTCTACIEACPTQALVQPYVLNANKCISYLTIEHRGDLPNKLISKFDNWIYGCDICQDACPWNRFQTKTKETVFLSRKENVAPELTDIIEMSQEEFSRRFKDSSIKRTKRSGLIRNAKAVLESQGSSR